MGVVDFHAHLLNEGGYAQALAEAARTLGFDALCLGGGKPCYGLATNEEVLEHARTYPDLFVPFADLELGRDGAARVEEMADAGFRGLKVSAPPKPYDDPDFFPVYEAARALGLPVLFHTGYVPATPMDRALGVRCEHMRPVYVDTVARHFPGLRVVGTSLGSPWCEEAFETLRNNDNVFFDLSGEVLKRKDLGYFRNLIRSGTDSGLGGRRTENPCSRLVFGSGAHVEEIEGVERYYQRLFRSLAVEDEVKERVMGGTARRLLEE